MARRDRGKGRRLLSGAPRHVVLVVLLAPLGEAPCLAQSISTIAGGGTDDFRAATAARLNGPSGIARDAAGNLYIADNGNNRIRKVSAVTGLITTVAGSGSTGYYGDGGPATEAALHHPPTVVVDAKGDLYIADQGNHAIRRVSASTGIITTVVGNGRQGFSGDGGPASAANLYAPTGVAFDPSGNLYIADSMNYRIRKVSASTGLISTVAGNGTEGFSGDGGPATAASLNYPRQVAAGPTGDLYIAEFYNRVRVVSAVTGVITTVAVGLRPYGLALDAAGDLFIADAGYHAIRRVSASTGIIATVAGNGRQGFSGDGGPATTASLSTPQGVCLDAEGDIFIADSGNARIRKVTAPTGVISTVAGSGDALGDGGPATAASLYWPQGVATDAAGNVYIADFQNSLVRRVSAATGVIEAAAGTGRQGFTGDGGPATAARLFFPAGVALDSSGNLYIADRGNHRIRKVSTAGTITTVAGDGSVGFSGDGGPATAAKLSYIFFSPAVDSAGNLYLADRDNNRVRKIAPGTGIITTVAGNGDLGYYGDGGPATGAAFSSPSFVALDASGNLFIADSNNHRVRKVDAGTGTIMTVAGNGGQGYWGDNGPPTEAGLDPEGVALNSSGDLFIAADQRIRKVSTTRGVITTVAGTGANAFGGDGGPASAANLSYPSGIAVDSAGNLYIADTFSNRVRAVFACRDRLGAFDSSYPTDGTTAAAGGLVLSWSSAGSAFRYDVLLDADFPPKQVLQKDVTGQGFQLSGLEPGRTYYWQVNAKGDPYCPAVERASSIRRFTVPIPCTPPAAPALTPPSNPGATTALSFSAMLGASSYDLYLGSGASPTLVASGLTSPSYEASGLLPGTTYRWRVVAHASCNTELTASSLESTFTTPGGCRAPPDVSLTGPVSATGLAASTTLRWLPVSGAGRFDVYLGTDSTPPLYASEVAGTSLPVILQSGATYRWKVVAKAACDPAMTSSSTVAVFSTSSACVAPAGPTTLSSAKVSANLGSGYVLSWPSVDGASLYRLVRSKSGDFSGGEAITTGQTSLLLTASESATYHHRVTALSACGTSGPASADLTVTVSASPPHVEMLGPPRAAVIAQPRAGALLPRLEVLVKNTGTTDFAGFFNTSQTVPFFIMGETMVSLRAGEVRIYPLQFSGVPTDKAGVYEGILSVNSSDPTDTTAYPQAYVSLNVTSLKTTDPVPSTSPPSILDDHGQPIDFLAFPPPTPARPIPEATIQIRNTSTVPLDLGADVLPDPWVSIESAGGSASAWNDVPIPPGASRSVKLKVQRIRGERGGALPRYTYLTFRTIDGKSSRLPLQDADPPASGPCAGRSVLSPSEPSLIVPSLVNAVAKGGGKYVSRLLITNLGPDPAQADLYYTPDTGDQGTDGYDCAKVLQATLVIPGLDLVSLTDPVGQLFGTTGSGQLEIRSNRIGQLRVQSVVDAPAPNVGSFGFQLPTVRSGEGARQGTPYSTIGVVQSASYRTNVILTETSGQRASVRLTLYDRGGAVVGTAERDMPPYAKVQLPVTDLSGGRELDAGAIEVDARPGSAGSVIALTTVIDNQTGDASSFVARPLKPETQSTRYAVPSVVYTAAFKSRLEIRNNDARSVTYKITYRGNTGTVESETRTLRPKQEDAWDNVLSELLNLPSGTFGPLAISADSPSLQVVSRVYTSTPAGTYGDAIEGVALDDPTTTGDSGRILLVDGLEGTADGNRSRGARTNLILSEISGGSATLDITIWEKTQRRIAPVGRMSVSLGPYQQKQINDIFGDEGFAIVQKDRLDVLCTVRPMPTSTGKVVALATRIDNLTNDTKNLMLRP